uniref:Reverse transcriptase domain-containing protein n=1 Tax=Steinernema glaseri TaxID=37863 RepID=A0A1I7YBL7_9BILA
NLAYQSYEGTCDLPQVGYLAVVMSQPKGNNGAVVEHEPDERDSGSSGQSEKAQPAQIQPDPADDDLMSLLKGMAASMEDNKRAMAAMADKVGAMEAKRQTLPLKEKSLKNPRWDHQVQLNSEWIHRLEEISEQNGSRDAMDSLIADMKARNMLLKKADAQPAFFRFFENHQNAHPELSLAECVTQALDRFNEIDAAQPAKLSTPSGRKRPFPGSGGGGSRAFVAINSRDAGYANLAAQVQQLRQQFMGGPSFAAPRAARGPSIQCY